jgi:hypothetical protein
MKYDYYFYVKIYDNTLQNGFIRITKNSTLNSILDLMNNGNSNSIVLFYKKITKKDYESMAPQETIKE